MRDYRKWCVACSHPSEGRWLCLRCQDIVDGEFADENPTIVRKYIDTGLAEIAASNEAHALFEQYLKDHPSEE